MNDFGANIIEQMTTMSDVEALLGNAFEPGLKPLVFPKTNEELEEELRDSSHLDEVEQRAELENALCYVTVSEAVRLECAEELRRGAQRGWKN